MFDCSHKRLPINTFSCIVNEDFASWRKARNAYTRILEFTFPGKDAID